MRLQGANNHIVTIPTATVSLETCRESRLVPVAHAVANGNACTTVVVRVHKHSGTSHHVVPDRDLSHKFVPFATKPRINTAKAGQYSYDIGYGDMHQLLHTSAGKRKTVLHGVWCVPGLSSRLFSVQAHLKSAHGNSCQCVLEFAVSVLHTLTFTLPLVDDPASGLFSFSAVAIVAGPPSALVAPACGPCMLLKVHFCSSFGCLASPFGPSSL